MADKEIDVPADTATDKPTELTDTQAEDVAGGVAKQQSIYDKPGKKFE